jgi:hypothetical protein
LIAQRFFRRLWTVVNRPEQALAPRAGLPEQCNINALDRLTAANTHIDGKGLFGTVANLEPKSPLTKRRIGRETAEKTLQPQALQASPTCSRPMLR